MSSRVLEQGSNTGLLLSIKHMDAHRIYSDAEKQALGRTFSAWNTNGQVVPT